MPTDHPHPILGLSGVEAGALLGVTQLTVSQFAANGVLPKAVRYQHNGLDRGDVERLSLERYKPGRPYWVTEREAARILGISRARVFSYARTTGSRSSSTTDGTTTGGRR